MLAATAEFIVRRTHWHGLALHTMKL